MIGGEHSGSAAHRRQPSRKGEQVPGFRAMDRRPETVQRILLLTEELKQRARALAHPNEARIRERAREIWEENDRPVGRDEEFWLQAEREFREAEELAKRDDA